MHVEACALHRTCVQSRHVCCIARAEPSCVPHWTRVSKPSYVSHRTRVQNHHTCGIAHAWRHHHMHPFAHACRLSYVSRRTRVQPVMHVASHTRVETVASRPRAAPSRVSPAHACSRRADPPLPARRCGRPAELRRRLGLGLGQRDQLLRADRGLRAHAPHARRRRGPRPQGAAAARRAPARPREGRGPAAAQDEGDHSVAPAEPGTRGRQAWLRPGLDIPRLSPSCDHRTVTRTPHGAKSRPS